MFFNHPRCGAGGWANGSGSQPRPCSSKSAGQNPFEQTINLEEFLEAIATAATVANSLAEPWIAQVAQMNKPGSSGKSACNKAEKSHSVSTTDNKFEVKLDVTNFSPEEINVKVVENSIVVEAKHEEKEDKFGFISRQFVRRFILPEGVIVEKMTCKMATDSAVLVISAPRLVKKPETNERSIPINFVQQKEASDAAKSDDAADASWEKIAD